MRTRILITLAWLIVWLCSMEEKSDGRKKNAFVCARKAGWLIFSLLDWVFFLIQCTWEIVVLIYWAVVWVYYFLFLTTPIQRVWGWFRYPFGFLAHLPWSRRRVAGMATLLFAAAIIGWGAYDIYRTHPVPVVTTVAAPPNTTITPSSPAPEGVGATTKAPKGDSGGWMSWLSAMMPRMPTPEETKGLSWKETSDKFLGTGHWTFDKASPYLGYIVPILLIFGALGWMAVGGYRFIKELKSPEWEGSYYWILGFVVFGTFTWFWVTGTTWSWSMGETIVFALAAITGLLALEKHKGKAFAIIGIFLGISLYQGHFNDVVQKIEREGKRIVGSLTPRSSRPDPHTKPGPSPKDRAKAAKTQSVFVPLDKSERKFWDYYEDKTYRKGFTKEDLRYELQGSYLPEGIFLATEISDNYFRKDSAATIIGKAYPGEVRCVWFNRKATTAGWIKNRWEGGTYRLVLAHLPDGAPYYKAVGYQRFDSKASGEESRLDPTRFSHVQLFEMFEALEQMPELDRFGVEIVPDSVVIEEEVAHASVVY